VRENRGWGFSLRKNADFDLALKRCGFSRTAKSFTFVIPSRPEPRLRGEDERGICAPAFFRILFSR